SPDQLVEPVPGILQPSITALEVLPGGGWDNLRNMDMGRVMNLSYSQCQTTEDGLYLLPDEVFVIPQKETGVESNSEVLSSWVEEKSSTSKSINMDISYCTELNAKFSVENERMKIHQVKDSSTTVRVQVRNLVYTAKAYPDFTVDSRFAQQVEEIADALENNQTKRAEYLSERMVLDFGTHVITSVDAGASLVQEDYLRSSYVSHNETQTTSISILAGLNFFDKLKFDISSKDTTQSSALQTYQSNIHYSLTQSHGGIPFYPGMTLQKWQESTRNNLVAIDRSGLPLQYFINTKTFPDMPQPTVGKVALSVSQAIERYYTVNTLRGCVDVSSKNYNFQANVDDKSCQGPATNLSFGGVFQQCIELTADANPLCQTLAQKNPDTGDYSCRSPYIPTLLRSEVRQESYSQYECHEVAYRCKLGLFRCHRKKCGDYYYVRQAKVKTYWCAVDGQAPDNSGYLFGGIYGPSLLNPISKTKSCPPYFNPVRFLSDGLMICESNDYEMAPANSVPFGGLFSCESANPLAGNQRRCPAGFSQHLATVSDGCEILYCVQSGLFTSGQLLPIHLPPFTLPPLISKMGVNTVEVLSEEGQSWVRVGQSNKWRLVKPEDIQDIVRQLRQDSGEMTAGSKAGLTLGIIGLLVLLAVGGVLLVRKKRASRRCRSYEQIDEQIDEQAQASETAVLLPEEEAQ
ncbi:hypothetical protein CRUP_011815, partial [Coryphaenoides rupestris]